MNRSNARDGNNVRSQTPATFGREVVLILLDTCRLAARRRICRIDADLILFVVAGEATLGKTICLAQDAARAIRRTELENDAASEGADEPDNPVANTPTQREIDGTLREVAWRAQHQFGGRGKTGQSPKPRWTRAVRGALEHALASATARDVRYAGTVHLLTGLLADESGRAHVLLRSANVDPDAVINRLRADTATEPSVEPYAPLIPSLEFTGCLTTKESAVLRVLQAPLRRRFARRSQYRSAVLGCLEEEMMRQAVRSGARIVSPVHALLAIVSLDSQLAVTARKLRPRSASFNRGGEVLDHMGISPTQLWNALESEAAAPARTEPVADTSRRFWKMTSPAWNAEISRQLDRSVEIAFELGHPETGTSHLLAALLEQDTAAAAQLLSRCGVAVSEIRDGVDRALSSALASRGQS
jgi:hypothetical protein